MKHYCTINLISYYNENIEILAIYHLNYPFYETVLVYSFFAIEARVTMIYISLELIILIKILILWICCTRISNEFLPLVFLEFLYADYMQNRKAEYHKINKINLARVYG